MEPYQLHCQHIVYFVRFHVDTIEWFSTCCPIYCLLHHDNFKHVLTSLHSLHGFNFPMCVVVILYVVVKGFQLLSNPCIFHLISGICLFFLICAFRPILITRVDHVEIFAKEGINYLLFRFKFARHEEPHLNQMLRKDLDLYEVFILYLQHSSCYCMEIEQWSSNEESHCTSQANV